MTISWALISGASTGIGRATALQLAAKGFHVLAGVRSKDAGAALTEASAGRVRPIFLDVTDQGSITAAIAGAAEMIYPSGLRVLMNNAGIVVPGPLEHVSPTDWRLQFDVNFFGMIELTRAALPLLRQGVTAHGSFVPRLLFTSSIGGRVSQPVLAPYTTSKFATSALGDALRIELRRQGIGVTVIEPGAVATNIWRKGDASSSEFHANHPARLLYGPEIDGLIAASKRIASNAISADEAAGQIVRGILAKKPPARLLVGTDAKVMATLRAWLPLPWFDELLKRELGIARLPVTGSRAN
jgi:NAD(P)-dependent dehydrogenase (short-subunit alcohol dehydrogenase family)